MGTAKRPGGAAGKRAAKNGAGRGAPELDAVRRKPLRVCMERVLASPPDEEERVRLAALGVPEGEQNRAMRLALALCDKACAGDVAACKEVRDLVGEGGARAGAWQEQIDALGRMYGALDAQYAAEDSKDGIAQGGNGE